MEQERPHCAMQSIKPLRDGRRQIPHMRRYGAMFECFDRVSGVYICGLGCRRRMGMVYSEAVSNAVGLAAVLAGAVGLPGRRGT